MLNHPETFRQRMQSHATRVFVHMNTPPDVWLDRSPALLVEVWVTISSTAICVGTFGETERAVLVLWEFWFCV